VKRAVGVRAMVLVASLTISGCAGAVPATTPSAAPSDLVSQSAIPTASAAVSLRFAVIGDYGTGNDHAAKVAHLVATWKPSFVIATGDDYYAPAGGRGNTKYDRSTGAFYCAWLADITTSGNKCPQGKAKTNAFFPALGNHDYSDATPGPATYLSYFQLPGAAYANSSSNERYYDFVQGPVHFFVLNSNAQEPDGISSTSVQARWLKAQLAASTSPWNVVYDHHPPYSSDSAHGSTTALRWPFAKWGANVVLSGHSHTYERIERNDIVYFVNGLGGAARYSFGTPISGSQAHYNANWGAQEATATTTSLTFAFRDVSGKLVDSYTLTR
jgi:tartrate-resistant acid phosphatase type 5